MAASLPLRKLHGPLIPLVLALGCAEESPIAPPPTVGPPPTLTAASPEDGAVRVPIDDALRLTFSAPMHPEATPGAVSLSVRDGDPVAVDVIVEGAAVTITPQANLTPLTRYVLTVDPAAASAEGAALESEVQVAFRTGGMMRVSPQLGTLDVVPVPCEGAFEMPPEFAGAVGLEAVGWTLDDLTNQVAWNLPSQFVTPWISDDTDARPSARVRPHLAPLAGRCFTRAVAPDDVAGTLADVLLAQSAFADRTTALGGLAAARYVPPPYDLDVDAPLVAALWGLYEQPNELPEAPAVAPWTSELQAELTATTSAWSMPLRLALARLVLAVGEAHIFKRAALAGVDDEVWSRLHAELRDGNYSGSSRFYAPVGGTFVQDVLDSAGSFDVAAMLRAAQGLAEATEAARQALAEAGAPGGRLELATPHGRVILDLEGQDSRRDADDLDGVALLVDAGGNDRYDGRYASTPHFWMSASVVLDAGAGADFHNLRMSDLESRGIRSRSAFQTDYLATQGAGLFGVGLLVDGGGPDQYQASVLAQGAGAFGVGALVDHGGDDVYKGTYMAQGLGYFGVGVLLDHAGQDRYVVGSHGQGVGRPGGHGLLLDGGGDDSYLALYVTDPPELPGDYARLFPSGYEDADGNDHNMNVAQGVGWGFRGDWFEPNRSWAGGLGALVDLGEGDDTHLGDCMVMGQGFVYGFGLLYDGGGDDHYRNFWWGIGSGTHMGTGVLIEAGGADDYFTTRASSGLGHDTGVAWFVDEAGDDVYGGQMTFGRSLQGGLAFFLELGGDDVYATAANRPNFGIVQIVPFSTLPRVGVFLDLGGGADTYPDREDIGNDQTWYQAPIGDMVDPDVQKGVGVDQ